MTAVYTLIVDGEALSYTADAAPSIGELVTPDGGAPIVRVLRSSDGGRIFVAEPVEERGT